jgi:DNA-binding CsgD family transcriptional regulator
LATADTQADAEWGNEEVMGSEGVQRWWMSLVSFGLLFLVLALFVAADIWADVEEGIGGLHIWMEGFSLGLAVLGFVGAAWKLRCAVVRTETLKGDLRRTRADLEHWRTEAETLLRQLGTALDNQFQRWGLTAAEREIALLVLRGLSYKDVANARGTTERTVRHQALAIYRKAGLTGRAEMAAFFLQALLLPARGEAEAPAPTPVPARATSQARA